MKDNTITVFEKAPVPRAVLKNAVPAMAAMLMVLICNLDYCYIHKVKGSINELCYQLNIDTSAAYRRRDLALRRFTLARYGPLPGL